MFYEGIQISTIAIYLLAVVIVITYMVLKFAKKGYLFSFYNIYIWMELAMLLLITPFLYSPDGVRLITGWSKSVSTSYYYMEKSMRLNCAGTCVFLMTLICKEFSNGKRKAVSDKNTFWNDLDVSLPFISESLMNMEYMFFLSLYAVICIFVLQGVPVSVDAAVLLNGIWRVPYLVCISVLPVFLLYFMFIFINERRGALKVLLGILACYSLGKRSSLILGVFYTALVYYIMFVKLNKLSLIRKYTKKIIVGCIVLVIAGLLMMLARSGINVGTDELFREMVYGNTFSDIRDGGLILYAFEKKNQTWLSGKTYLADFFIFIPSAVFKYRRVYGYGAYTANTLLGMVNHPGLRGGGFMESYLNFGYPGIVVNALIRGWFVGKYEKFFNANMLNRVQVSPSKALVIMLWTQVLNLFTCSGGFNSVYSILVILLINYLIYQIAPGLRFPEYRIKRRKV